MSSKKNTASKSVSEHYHSTMSMLTMVVVVAIVAIMVMGSVMVSRYQPAPAKTRLGQAVFVAEDASGADDASPLQERVIQESLTTTSTSCSGTGVGIAKQYLRGRLYNGNEYDVTCEYCHATSYSFTANWVYPYGNIPLPPGWSTNEVYSPNLAQWCEVVLEDYEVMWPSDFRCDFVRGKEADMWRQDGNRSGNWNGAFTDIKNYVYCLSPRVASVQLRGGSGGSGSGGGTGSGGTGYGGTGYGGTGYGSYGSYGGYASSGYCGNSYYGCTVNGASSEYAFGDETTVGQIVG